MAGRGEQNPPAEELPSHTWLQFPTTINNARRQRYFGELGRIHKKDEPIFREITLEFLSTVQFEQYRDLSDRTAFSFRLGGVSRECSVMELGIRLGLYTWEETALPMFSTFFEACLRIPPADFRLADVWGMLANEAYESHTAVESMLRSPVHRVLHRLIASTVNHRKGGDKVPVDDVFYLWCLTSEGVCLNLPYTLAVFLSRKAKGAKRNSPISGGHLISRLAISYDIFSSPHARGLTGSDPHFMNRSYLYQMRVIDQDDHSREEDPVEQGEDMDAQPEPQQDVPEQEIDLRFLSQQISRMDLSRQRDAQRIESSIQGIQRDIQMIERDILRRQVHDQWVSHSMQGFYESQGYQPPIPYPTYVPPVPTWFEPPDFLQDYGDGGGTSGSAFDDTDD
ncbi:hypothetical protein L2E82_30820 [Cichorium intybus]|uniref:Uncharacterized protein n=1 Tax=Cichorium intybus TaxID=13427 RepID=A0ACB9D1N8_CICIN|nr:hypothetical protein L2E82_30820 [Cichorium intybus]